MTNRRHIGNSRSIAAVLALLLSCTGCEFEPRNSREPPRPESQARTFSDHWRAVVDDLVQLREASKEGVAALTGLRNRIHKHFYAMRQLARRDHERAFLEISRSGLDELVAQVDEVVNASRHNDPRRSDDAILQIGFILEEMAKLTELAGI